MIPKYALHVKKAPFPHKNERTLSTSKDIIQSTLNVVPLRESSFVCIERKEVGSNTIDNGIQDDSIAPMISKNDDILIKNTFFEIMKP